MRIKLPNNSDGSTFIIQAMPQIDAYSPVHVTGAGVLNRTIPIGQSVSFEPVKIGKHKIIWTEKGKSHD